MGLKSPGVFDADFYRIIVYDGIGYAEEVLAEDPHSPTPPHPGRARVGTQWVVEVGRWRVGLLSGGLLAPGLRS